jgi:hypothetical protein
MSITIEKIDETTYKVTVSDRTATTHMVTVAGASVIKCWQSDRNSSPWYSLRLNLRPSVLASTRSTNHEESQLSQPAPSCFGKR